MRPVPPADHLMPDVICDPYSGRVTSEFAGIENALNTVTAVTCPSVTVTVWAEAVVFVMRIAITQEVVAVRAALELGTVCQAGVNAAAPQAVFGATVSGVMPDEPCTVITSADALPAVPGAGCFAAVAAPVGSEIVPDTLVTLHVPL